MLILLTLLLLFDKIFNTSKYFGSNLYQITGLDQNSEQKDIIRSYKLLLHQKKIMTNPNSQTLQQWEKADFAFSIIGSEQSRALYDAFGFDSLNITDFHVYGFQNDETIESIHKMFGSVPDEIALFGGIIFYPVEFELRDFLFGANKTITSVHTVDCEGKKLPQCSKDAVYYDSIDTYTITLPPGAPEFYRVIVKGAGDNMGSRGAADIAITAISKPHPIFKRKGNNLHMTLDVTMLEALQDINITIEGLDGNPIEIPVKHVQHDQEIVVPNKGMPDFLLREIYGDLIIKINLVFPEQLTDQQKDDIKTILLLEDIKKDL